MLETSHGAWVALTESPPQVSTAQRQGIARCAQGKISPMHGEDEGEGEILEKGHLL